MGGLCVRTPHCCDSGRRSPRLRKSLHGRGADGEPLPPGAVGGLVRQYREETRNGPRFGVVAFTPDGRAVVVGSRAGSVRLFVVGSGRQLLRSDPKPGEDASCTAVACSPDGRLVASAEFGSAIVLWEIASGREVGRFHPTAGRNVQALAFSPDSRILASGSDDPTVLLWEIPDSARKPRR